MSTFSTTNRRQFIYRMGIVAAPLLTKPLRPFSFLGNTKANTHRILTCNIRVALPEDEVKGFGWSARKDICIAIIRQQQADIIGFQEVIKPQMDDLKAAFPDFIGFGFEGPEMDAHPVGYHGIAKNPILFLKTRYELLAAGEFWLSETPLKAGSLSWNTARARHANWVRLKDKKSGKDFRFINLHLDHISQEARENQIKLVMDEANQYAADYPQILTGDFNSSAANSVYRIIMQNGWKDSYTVLHGQTEPGYTVHQFKGEHYEKKATGKKIDFIFTHGPVQPTEASIIKDNKNGHYPSDHYFVSATLTI